MGHKVCICQSSKVGLCWSRFYVMSISFPKKLTRLRKNWSITRVRHLFGHVTTACKQKKNVLRGNKKSSGSTLLWANKSFGLSTTCAGTLKPTQNMYGACKTIEPNRRLYYIPLGKQKTPLQRMYFTAYSHKPLGIAVPLTNQRPLQTK